MLWVPVAREIGKSLPRLQEQVRECPALLNGFLRTTPALYMPFRLCESDIEHAVAAKLAGRRSPDLQVKESGENRRDNERFVEPAFRAIYVY